MSASVASELTVGGRVLAIEPVRVRDLPRFLAAIEPVMHELARGDVLAALARQADHVIEATAIGAGVERAELDAESVDVLVDLALRVMEVNADFFMARLLPRIGEASGRLLAIASGGTTGSPDSSAPASVSRP